MHSRCMVRRGTETIWRLLHTFGSVGERLQNGERGKKMHFLLFRRSVCLWE